MELFKDFFNKRKEAKRIDAENKKKQSRIDHENELNKEIEANALKDFQVKKLARIDNDYNELIDGLYNSIEYFQYWYQNVKTPLISTRITKASTLLSGFPVSANGRNYSFQFETFATPIIDNNQNCRISGEKKFIIIPFVFYAMFKDKSELIKYINFIFNFSKSKEEVINFFTNGKGWSKRWAEYYDGEKVAMEFPMFTIFFTFTIENEQVSSVSIRKASCKRGFEIEIMSLGGLREVILEILTEGSEYPDFNGIDSYLRKSKSNYHYSNEDNLFDDINFGIFNKNEYDIDYGIDIYKLHDVVSKTKDKYFRGHCDDKNYKCY